MKYMRSFFIILLICLIAEALNYYIPLPIPASIYGLVVMFAALCLKIIKPEDVKDVSGFLICIMPMMFIPAGVGLIAKWDAIRPHLGAILIIMIVSTILVMAVSGCVTQALLRGENEK